MKKLLIVLALLANCVTQAQTTKSTTALPAATSVSTSDEVLINQASATKRAAVGLLPFIQIGAYTNPSFVASLPWSKITAAPTTLAGYGITDGTSNARSAISLTTTGTTGSATYNSSTGVLNIPQYAGASGEVIYANLSGTTWDGNAAYKVLSANTALTLTTAHTNGLLYIKQPSAGLKTASIDAGSGAITLPIGKASDKWSGVTFSVVNGEYLFAVDTSVVSGVVAADLTAPTLSTATVANASPNHVDLVFDEAMNATWSASSAFTVGGHTVSSITRSTATTGFITVTPDFTAGETRTLGYTQPGSNKMQDLAGNLLANISAASITDNVVGGDVTQPMLVSATVEDASPTHVDLVFDEAMNSTWSAASAFTITSHTVSSVTRSTSTTGFLTLSTAVTAGEVPTIGYTQPGSNKMQDLSANLLANISAGAVINNVAPAGTPTWRDPVNTMTAANFGVKRASGGTSGVMDANACTVQTFAVGDNFEWEMPNVDGRYIIGFTTSSGALANYDAGVFLENILGSRNMSRFEAGSFGAGFSGAWAPGDRMRLERRSTEIRFYKWITGAWVVQGDILNVSGTLYGFVATDVTNAGVINVLKN